MWPHVKKAFKQSSDMTDTQSFTRIPWDVTSLDCNMSMDVTTRVALRTQRGVGIADTEFFTASLQTRRLAGLVPSSLCDFVVGSHSHTNAFPVSVPQQVLIYHLFTTDSSNDRL